MSQILDLPKRHILRGLQKTLKTGWVYTVQTFKLSELNPTKFEPN